MADDDETNLIDQLAAGQADLQDEGKSGEGKESAAGATMNCAAARGWHYFASKATEI